MFIQIRNQTRIFLIVIFGLLLTFLIFYSFSSVHQRRTADLIQVVGRQRMLTQMIAKDASRISVLYEARVSPDRIEPQALIDDKINAAKAQLIQAISEYESTHKDMMKGYVMAGDLKIKLSGRVQKAIEDDLKSIDDAWIHYKANAYVIINNTANDRHSRQALIYVNGNDFHLLTLNQMLIGRMIDTMNGAYTLNRISLFAILMAISLVAVISVRRLYVFLYKPLDFFFMGFHDIGLMDYQDQVTPKGNTLQELKTEAEDMFKGIQELIALMENINHSASFKETLEYIFNTFTPYVPYSHVGIALIHENSKKSIVASYGISEEKHRGLAGEFMGYEVDLNETTLMQIVETGQPRVINDYKAYFKERPIREYSEIILKYGINSSITLPLMANNRHLGFIFFSSAEPNVYKEKHVQFLKTVGNAIALSMEKNVIVDDLVYSSVLALAKLAEAKDEDTGSHLHRMKESSVLLAKLMMKDARYKALIDGHFISEIAKFSPMHDIGKVGISDSILLKPGKLNEEEFEVMKTHTLYGAEVLSLAEENVKKNGKNIFTEGIAIARGHHEKWDGSGYPHGLQGEAIPLSARIVMVADVLDALMSKRPYKEAFSFEKSIKIILEGKGKHFDPQIIDIFAANSHLFKIIYEKNPG